ncbi:MAG TPA: M20/M25/M40 family metallo-hydrolase [Acidimicrobiales bacterium]|nr:M20/M25/M40 family metallo-hydrolase [Acidimicrobiales bacterium]
MTTTPASLPPAPPELLAGSEELWENDALPVLSEYVRIRCLSPEFDAEWADRGEIRRAADLLASWARDRQISGLRVEVVELPGLTPVVLAEAPATGAGAGEATTLLYGHLDKQPPLGAWRSGLAPFEPVREGDRLYGRGTADDGYSIFAALGAIELLERAGLPHGRCIAIIEASEESGSPHLGAYLELLGQRIGPAGPALVVGLDSGATTYDRLWTTTSLRGLVAATLRVRVLEEAIHSGAGGGVVPDSFRLLRQLLSRIEDEQTGKVLLDSVEVPIPPGRCREAEALLAEIGGASLDRFPTTAGLVLAGGASEHEALLARSWSASLAVIGMDGLPAVADAGNVIRPFTTAKLSLRIPPSADAAAVAAELAAALSADPPDGAEVEVADAVGADGFDAPEMAPWLEAATEQASLSYFGAPARGMGEGGTIPFLSELQRSCPSAQFLVTGVLGPESNAHGPNEMLHLPTAIRVTAAVAHVLSRVP